MLRIKQRKSRGRPFGSPSLFLVDCLRLDATALLAKSRGARFDPDQTGADVSRHWTFQWTEDGRTRSRSLALAVTTTLQPLGGVRRWWRCPDCRRRCRVLVIPMPESAVGCRVYLPVRYVTDYPARGRRRRFVALVHGLRTGMIGVDGQEELDLLLAPRRRGGGVATTLGAVVRAAQEMVQHLYREAGRIADEEARRKLVNWALACEAEPRLRAMIALAHAQTEIAISTTALDADPWLLNCRNGTVNLKTGRLRPHRATDYLTKIAAAAYLPEAVSPLWQKVLTEALPDPAVRSYLQVLAGYTACGVTNADVTVLLHPRARRRARRRRRLPQASATMRSRQNSTCLPSVTGPAGRVPSWCGCAGREWSRSMKPHAG